MSITLKNSANFYQLGDVSQSFDVSGGNMLVVGIISDATAGTNRDVQTVKFDSVSFTNVYQVDDAPSTNNASEKSHLYWYILPNPSSGSHTLEITMGGTTPEWTGFIASIDGVSTLTPGTNYGFEFNNTDGAHDPTIALSISQTVVGDSIAFLLGSVYAGAGSSNYHDSSSNGYTEIIDSQGINGNTNGGKYANYKVYTDGVGTKTIDNGDNNYPPAGPGSPRTHAEIAILFQQNLFIPKIMIL